MNGTLVNGPFNLQKPQGGLGLLSKCQLKLILIHNHGTSAKARGSYGQRALKRKPEAPPKHWFHLISFMPLLELASTRVLCTSFPNRWCFGKKTFGQNSLQRTRSAVDSQQKTKETTFWPAMLKSIRAISNRSNHRHSIAGPVVGRYLCKSKKFSCSLPLIESLQPSTTSEAELVRTKLIFGDASTKQPQWAGRFVATWQSTSCGAKHFSNSWRLWLQSNTRLLHRA